MPAKIPTRHPSFHDDDDDDEYSASLNMEAYAPSKQQQQHQSHPASSSPGRKAAPTTNFPSFHEDNDDDYSASLNMESYTPSAEQQKQQPQPRRPLSSYVSSPGRKAAPTSSEAPVGYAGGKKNSPARKDFDGVDGSRLESYAQKQQQDYFPNSSSANSSSRMAAAPTSAMAAASLETDDHEDEYVNETEYLRQQSAPAAEAAMFAIASNSSSSASERSHQRRARYAASPMYGIGSPQYTNHQHKTIHQPQHEDFLQPKDPPRYDSRPRLKNDMSDKYQPMDKPTKPKVSVEIGDNYTSGNANNYASGNNNNYGSSYVNVNSQRISPQQRTTRKQNPQYQQQRQQQKQYPNETSPHFRHKALQSHSGSRSPRSAKAKTVSRPTSFHNNSSNTNSYGNQYTNGRDPQRTLSLPVNNQYLIRKNETKAKAPSDPRPKPSAGRPPATTTGPIAPVSLQPRLGRRGLLLGRTKHPPPPPPTSATASPQLYHYESSNSGHRSLIGASHHMGASLGGRSGSQHSFGHLEDEVLRDPGPKSLPKSVKVECTGCGDIIQHVPKNSVALECPQCKEFYPTVTCRVVL